MHRPKVHFSDEQRHTEGDAQHVRVLCGKVVNPKRVPVILAATWDEEDGAACADCQTAHMRLRRRQAAQQGV